MFAMISLLTFPDHVPANPCGLEDCLVSDRLGSEVSALFLFVFGDCFVASCAGAGVAFSSSTIGAGERCAINKIDSKIKRKRTRLLTEVKAAPCNFSRQHCIRTIRFVRHRKIEG